MIGAILAGGAGLVQAEVTLFGQIDNSYVFEDQDGGDDGSNFECTTCSLGFKGSEDLGNGLKAIFHLDFQYDTNLRNPQKTKVVKTVTTSGGAVTNTVKTDVDSTSSITDRDQWLGLAGGFGQVRVGTISTTYKSHGAMIDPIYRTSQQNRDRGVQSNMHTGAGVSGQGRAENTVRYDSPSWNGLKGAATYTISPDDQNDGDNGYGGGISYENAGVLVFADYITNDTGKDDSAYKLGGKYTLNNLSLYGQYEFDKGLISSKQPDTSGDGANLWMLGASYMLGNSMLYFSYGSGDRGTNGSTLTDYNVWELVGTHNMSKRTKLYAGFSELDCDNRDDNYCHRVGKKGGEDDKFSFGMQHKF
jgi:predicted porin